MKISKPDKNPEETVVKTEVLKEIRKRVVKSFLDVIILANLKDGGAPMGGYDVISFIKKELKNSRNATRVKAKKLLERMGEM